jgi:hypothetical protein
LSLSSNPNVSGTDANLEPWVTVDANGTASTVTPVLTTINGVATTLHAQPAVLTNTATRSASTDAAATATATDSASTPTQTAGGAFKVCVNKDGFNAPFCLPTNGTELNAGETHYITWDPKYFPGNTSVIVVANYHNTSIGGVQAYQSNKLPSTTGWTTIKIEEAYLQSMSRNSLDLFITTTGGDNIAGPIIDIKDPNAIPVVPYVPTQLPTGQSLYIALPTVFGFIILCVCGTFFWNRKHRQIGLGNVMGRRQGYGAPKSRRQRLGLGKKGAIALREQELTADGAYRDAPAREDIGDGWETQTPGHRRTGSEGLASLVGTPTDERFGNRTGGNVFRDEIRRQDGERF